MCKFREALSKVKPNLPERGPKDTMLQEERDSGEESTIDREQEFGQVLGSRELCKRQESIFRWSRGL